MYKHELDQIPSTERGVGPPNPSTSLGEGKRIFSKSIAPVWQLLSNGRSHIQDEVKEGWWWMGREGGVDLGIVGGAI